MSALRNWKFTTDTGNTICVAAQSKSQARKQYGGMFGSMGRVVSVEDDGPARQTLPNPWKQEAARRPVTPITAKRKQKPNERCACGSGKKFKRCHGRGSGPSIPVRPLPPSPPEGDERKLHDLRGDDLPDVRGEG